MEELSGKEAAQAIIDGEKLIWRKPDWRMDECEDVDTSCWTFNEVLNCKSDSFFGVEFYLKPKTITINGIEVPAPFEPKDGEKYYYLRDCKDGYDISHFSSDDPVIIGAWRTEDEIKQVVAALKNIFNGVK